ncbi:MAG: M23 family metallopeptidase [Candidatus Thiothrix moscowensis]|nr:M23 family metallopeptidase [Candidatus Thiothrix moscowensis]
MNKPMLLLGALTIFMMGYWIPEDRHVPVEGAKPYDWNPASFWYVGGLNAQKGINIFASKGTPVEATTGGWVIYRENDPEGDNSVWVLGAKWRLHHYANMDSVNVQPASWVKTGEQIGTVGTPVSAKPRPANLYYSIRSLPPQVSEWEPDKPFGLDRVFYVNPHEFLTAYQATDSSHEQPSPGNISPTPEKP